MPILWIAVAHIDIGIEPLNHRHRRAGRLMTPADTVAKSRSAS
jgi:hypothetical protein